MKKTPYRANTKTALGEYLQGFLNERGISYQKLSKEADISMDLIRMIMYSNNHYIRLGNYFKIAEYMTENSNLSIEHYLRRLKEHIEDGIKIKTRKDKMNNE